MKIGTRQILASVINELDKRLVDEYNSPIAKVDYYTFVYWLERMITMNDSHTECQFRNNEERLFWGRIKFNGKMVWKLDKIISTLEKHEILYKTPYRFDVDKSFSRTYFFGLNYNKAIEQSDTSKLVYVEVNENIIHKIEDTKYDINNPQYKLLMSDRFNIDIDSCSRFIDTMYPSKEVIYKRMASDIHDKRIYLTNGEVSGRITSSFVNLKRELRQYCAIDNEQLISLDLKSSQAYLLANMLLDDNEETKRFYDIVTKEDIYNHLNEHLSIGRDATKAEFFHYLYKGNSGSYTPLQTIFKSLFPYVYEKICTLNRNLNKENKKLVWLLQQKEAEIFIPIANKFALRGCLSVHDALYFKGVLREEINNDLVRVMSLKGYSDYVFR